MPYKQKDKVEANEAFYIKVESQIRLSLRQRQAG